MPGRDIVGIAFRDVRAAEDEELEMVDMVRVRSGMDLMPMNRLGDGTGRVATECNDEMDDFRDGRELGWADVGV